MTDLQSGSRSERLDRAIHALLSQTPEIEAAAVVSFDGLPMAAALPPSMDEDRVAAMSAALLSLGERAAQGLGRGELSQVYIEGDAGTVFLISADDEAVLVAVAAKGAKVGMMLYEVKLAAASVATILRSDDAPFVPEPVQSPVQAEPVVESTPTYAETLATPTYAETLASPTYAETLATPTYAEPAATYEPAAPAFEVETAFAEPAFATEPTYSTPAPAIEPTWSSSYAPSGSLPPATWS